MKYKVAFLTREFIPLIRHWEVEVEAESEGAAENYVKGNYLNIVRDSETDYVDSDFVFPSDSGRFSEDIEFAEVSDVEEA